VRHPDAWISHHLEPDVLSAVAVELTQAGDGADEVGVLPALEDVMDVAEWQLDYGSIAIEADQRTVELAGHVSELLFQVDLDSVSDFAIVV
jgi:hypothetical protein